MLEPLPGPPTWSTHSVKSPILARTATLFPPACVMVPCCPPATKNDMQPDNQPVRISLEELRSFASVLTDGSLLKHATLRVIAEQEDCRRHKEAKALELLMQHD